MLSGEIVFMQLWSLLTSGALSTTLPKSLVITEKSRTLSFWYGILFRTKPCVFTSRILFFKPQIFFDAEHATYESYKKTA